MYNSQSGLKNVHINFYSEYEPASNHNENPVIQYIGCCLFNWLASLFLLPQEHSIKRVTVLFLESGKCVSAGVQVLSQQRLPD